MKITSLLMSAALALSMTANAATTDYPQKPVTVIVPYTEGSATDVIARMVSGKLSEMWGQPVNIMNVAGAGGSTGAGKAAKSAADGYTLLVHSNSFAVNLAAYAKPPYSRKDFTDIAPLGSQPYSLVVTPNTEINSVADLIASAKANPGQMKFGSAGTGSSTHLVAENFKSKAGIDTVHVPYKGGPEANAATSSGEVTYWFPPSSIAIKGAKDGKFKVVAVTSASRFGPFPDVPTLSESGLKGFDVNGWWGLWAPAGIPAQAKTKLVKDVAQALASADLREKLISKGFEPMNMTPAQFSKLIKKEQDNAAKTLKAAGISPK